jgi:hypothetical protein
MHMPLVRLDERAKVAVPIPHKDSARTPRQALDRRCRCEMEEAILVKGKGSTAEAEEAF